MKKVAILAAPGFEEIELMAPLDILRRLNMDVALAGVQSDKVVSTHEAVSYTHLDVYKRQVQATVFSPAKKGIVKDIVGTSRMGFASGIVELASILSLLIGQIGVFIWFRYLLELSLIHI